VPLHARMQVIADAASGRVSEQNLATAAVAAPLKMCAKVCADQWD